jgi:hypothetical protein
MPQTAVSNRLALPALVRLHRGRPRAPHRLQRIVDEHVAEIVDLARALLDGNEAHVAVGCRIDE